ncbi:NTE family protein [Paraburkholderia sp. BL6665CI2N2]|uniref:patatin-like phospholipase family protein n=1 Tax=Paraburkholderia sp. BL6665CI2N2 TaxID=1938806 RepID=UPI0010664764|nr:patatin-like phospholipase family protein [Paraburkholderia sp. BL6665CI2N2]TDY21589.1 NTE family protein [Paraburkholderia sp. BL6665CI2N2]
MATTKDIPMIGLALQGGGAHAAFTWGVLDRLLDEVGRGTLSILAISGASGGALNAAACTYGLSRSPTDAKRALEQLWTLVGAASKWQPFYNLPTDLLKSPERWNVDLNPVVLAQSMLEPLSSPYAMPWLTNSLGSIMETVIPDFGVVNHPKDAVPQLFLAATNVNLTALRIFGPGEISAKALMASACFPTLFEAVKIDGEFYWDGGYLANPALAPLVKWADDILSVLIDPLRTKHGPPERPSEINNRINEISFGASWVAEVRQIQLINELVAENPGLQHHGKPYSPKRFHVIRADRFMDEIGAASKNTPSIEFFRALREAGHATADTWVRDCLPRVGKTSTFDLDKFVKNRVKGTPTAMRTVQRAEGEAP